MKSDERPPWSDRGLWESVWDCGPVLQWLIPAYPRVLVIVFCQYWGVLCPGPGIGDWRRQQEDTDREHYERVIIWQPPLLASDWSALPSRVL